MPLEGNAKMATVAQTLPATGEVMTDALDRRKRIIAIVGASSGNLVEWYDFYTYAFTSIYFASAFFPSGDPTSQLLATAGIFAVGFFMRPLGGWLFGWIADKHGRKNSMVISVLMMCAGSLMIAVLPTYHTIGALAPVLLLVARLVQGLSVGGGVRHGGDLHERGRGQGTARVLLVIPVCHPDWRTAPGTVGSRRSAASVVG